MDRSPDKLQKNFRHLSASLGSIGSKFGILQNRGQIHVSGIGWVVHPWERRNMPYISRVEILRRDSPAAERHLNLARLFKAGSNNASPLLVAAATVETDDQYQPSLPRLKQ